MNTMSIEIVRDELEAADHAIGDKGQGPTFWVWYHLALAAIKLLAYFIDLYYVKLTN